MKLISYVIPAYNEENNIPQLIQQFLQTVELQSNYHYELIIVDDGSTDHTCTLIERERKHNPSIHYIKLSKNFGSHAAISAGLTACRGDAAVIMAADLQDPPATIKSLIAKWEDGFDIVWACRKTRDGENFFTKLTSRAYYWLMNRISNVQQSALGADFFLIDRKALDRLNQIPVKNSSILMLAAWIGFKQTSILYDKKSRCTGKSKWTLYKKLNLFLNSILSFSDFIFSSILSFSLGLTAIGLLSLTISFFYGFLLILFGIQVFFISMLCLYLQRNFEFLSLKPAYIIEDTSINKSQE